MEAESECSTVDVENDPGDIEMDGGNDGDMGGDMDDSNSECEAAPTTASEDSCFGDILNTSIYHNSKIYLVTSLLLVMSFALKHNLTDAALKDLLQLISYFVPTPNICITSLYAFKKFFHSTQLRTNRVYYCKVCKYAIEDMLSSFVTHVNNIIQTVTSSTCVSRNRYRIFFVDLVSFQLFNTASLVHPHQDVLGTCTMVPFIAAIYRSLSELGGFLLIYHFNGIQMVFHCSNLLHFQCGPST